MGLVELGYEEVIDCSGIHYFKGNKYIEISQHNNGVFKGNMDSYEIEEYLTIEEIKAFIEDNNKHNWIK